MSGVVSLQQLMAGIGASGVRNLHVADISHAYMHDFTTFISPESRRAMRAGGFTNVIVESAVSDNEIARRPGGLATVFERDGLNLYFPDARFGAYELTINRHAPAQLNVYRQHTNEFLALAQVYQGNIPNAAEADSTLVNLFPNLNSTQRSQVVAAYRTGRLGPDLWGNIVSNQLNADTTTNIERETPTGGRVFFYGAAHTHGRANGQNFELTGRADMDTAFPGYTMAILRNTSERESALTGSDDPDFLYYLDATGSAQIEDLRSPAEKARLPLSQLLSQGTAALSGRQQQPAPPAPPAPPATPTPPRVTPPAATPETDNDDVITAPETQDDVDVTIPGTGGDNNIFSPENLRNLPFGSIIGGAIGAWLASGIGNGIGRMIIMAIGGLIGWMIGGNFGRREHEGQDAPAASSTADTQAPTTPVPATTPVVQQPAASQSLANALAFANVASVEISGAYPSAHVSNSELPNAQSLVLPPVVEAARTTIIQ